MKLIILGGTGMLGHKLFQILHSRFPQVYCTTREDVHKHPFDKVELLQGCDVITRVDVTETDKLFKLLQSHRPDYIINCVGIIKQRDEAKMPIPSITLNSLLPHQLAVMAKKWNGRVIHFSTDCVFSGKRGFYSETDVSDAEDLYGRSKYLGEVSTENALTLRTSIIGHELVRHRSLLDWFLSQNNKSVRGFTKVIYSGITTNQMAEVITMVLQKFPTLSGLFQVVSEPISKYRLLCLFRDAYGLKLEIIPDDKEVLDRSMEGDKFLRTTGYVSPSWPELVSELAQDNTPYDRWIK